MRKVVIGIMGPGQGARDIDRQVAYELGRSIALEGWVLLTGGRNVGVMEAANRGAKSANGLTVGILPGADDLGISEFVDIAIFTDMGNARNNINILSSDVVVACGMGAGTASEVALALKSNKPVLLLNCDRASDSLWEYRPTQIFFQQLSPEKIEVAQSVEEAMTIVKQVLSENGIAVSDER
ncbi:MAG TPA: TIGR00725 family protein [Oscillatoriales cyanobacterium M59_W2019_021]|nr:TIGR00725 family protein [Oscillatoriales cyanobacterium M4454_W2019_049]HIK51708.1 TIGR00725 family protein [Oscillatoriales cyanobacterium M59_W2019_021]